MPILPARPPILASLAMAGILLWPIPRDGIGAEPGGRAEQAILPPNLAPAPAPPPPQVPPGPPRAPVPAPISEGTLRVMQEAAAPPSVKASIRQARERVQANRLTFQVGFTSASTRTLSQLAGTRPPPDLKAAAALQNRVADSELARHPKLLVARARLVSAGVVADPTLAKFDWSQLDVVGSVKDQKFCGDCWDFATVGVFESMYAIRNGARDNLLDLSEEQLLRCNTESPKGTCCGGWWGFDFIKDSGLVGNVKLPYASGSVECLGGQLSAGVPGCDPSLPGRRYKATTWGYVSAANEVPTPAQIKQALCEHGPLIAAVNVTDQFQHYTSGLFDEQDPGEINHAVMIVGWNQLGWIVRNSWGPGWGQAGYINIAFDSNKIGFGAAWVEPVIFAGN